MKIMHLSDLHLGKRVNEFSMIDDQRYILKQVMDIVINDKADAVIIAGDVYDRQVPPVQAVELFDAFLTGLMNMNIPVLVISGNHDSAERIAFGSDIMSTGHIYMSRAYDGKMQCVTLEDEYGPVNFYMLPFIKPSYVRPYFDDDIKDYNDAVRLVIQNAEYDPGERNVIISHQFVTGAQTCQSEEITVGGLDNVDASAYAFFDYAALGHIHGPQNMGDRIRYCGTLLKYSFSEINHKKSVTLVELGPKGEVNIELKPIKPLRDMREIKGTYMELTARDFYRNLNTDDYYHIILTDEEDIYDAAAKLRVIYPNLMKITYDNIRTRNNMDYNTQDEHRDDMKPEDFLNELYELQNGCSMNEEQMRYAKELFEKVRENA